VTLRRTSSSYYPIDGEFAQVQTRAGREVHVMVGRGQAHPAQNPCALCPIRWPRVIRQDEVTTVIEHFTRTREV
jgi:hypothetical protein